MEANDRLIAAKQREIVLARDIVRPVAENLHDDIGGLENLGARGGELGALLHVVGVGIAGTHSRAGFHQDLETGLDQIGHNHRNQRHAPLAGKASLGTPTIISNPPLYLMTGCDLMIGNFVRGLGTSSEYASLILNPMMASVQEAFAGVAASSPRSVLPGCMLKRLADHRRQFFRGTRKVNSSCSPSFNLLVGTSTNPRPKALFTRKTVAR